MLFKSQLAGHLLDDEHVAWLGSNAEDKYLVPWKESSHIGGIEETTSKTDPQMMKMEKPESECADSVREIKHCVRRG